MIESILFSIIVVGMLWIVAEAFIRVYRDINDWWDDHKDTWYKEEK